jgi:hypothetical protein
VTGPVFNGTFGCVVKAVVSIVDIFSFWVIRTWSRPGFE